MDEIKEILKEKGYDMLPVKNVHLDKIQKEINRGLDRINIFKKIYFETDGIEVVERTLKDCITMLENMKEE